jgi:hypothetical protein
MKKLSLLLVVMSVFVSAHAQKEEAMTGAKIIRDFMNDTVAGLQSCNKDSKMYNKTVCVQTKNSLHLLAKKLSIHEIAVIKRIAKELANNFKDLTMLTLERSDLTTEERGEMLLVLSANTTCANGIDDFINEILKKDTNN